MPFNLGVGEILVVLVVALLVFGGRLPEVGRSLGRSLTEFKKGLKGMGDEIDDPVPLDRPEDPESPAARSRPSDKAPDPGPVGGNGND